MSRHSRQSRHLRQRLLGRIVTCRNRGPCAIARRGAQEEDSMLTRYAAGVLAVVAAVLTAAPARAQIQSGSLVVKAVDEQGAVMPGATITVTSPALPREM